MEILLQFVYFYYRKIDKPTPCYFPPADFSPQVAHPKLKIASAQSSQIIHKHDKRHSIFRINNPQT